jgi:L-threonylcarbamoyladenylate synthase
MSADPQLIARAVALLQAGELVALPTETVYGLGADAANPAAVAKIFAAKGRPADHPLIVHIAGDDYLERWARDIPAVAYELAEAFWPGPLTMILKRTALAPDAVTGGQDTVGLRVPGHPLALQLLRAFAAADRQGGGGIAAPSANRFGRISPTEAAHVREELGEGEGSMLSLILDGGPCTVGIESTILDLSRLDSVGPVLLRPGHISPEQLALVLGDVPLVGAAAAKPGAVATPRVSGSLDAHYAPQTPLKIVTPARLLDYLNVVRHRGSRCAALCHSQPPHAGMPHAWRMLPADPVGYAHELYAALRELDAAGAEMIVVEAIPEGPPWAAVADRLRRAAAGAGGGAYNP